MDDNLPVMSFEERGLPHGIYSTCYRDFCLDLDSSLSQLDYPMDFFGETNPWPPNRFATRFFRPNDAHDELVVTLFGEVLDESCGTGLGARGGSAFKRSQVNPLASCYQLYLR